MSKERKKEYKKEYYLSRKKPFEIRGCVWCEKEFMPSFRMNEKYCCKLCSQFGWREKNREYKLKQDKEYYKKNKLRLNRLSKEWRDEVLFGGNRVNALKRDDYTCCLCNAKKQLVVHHIDGSGQDDLPNNDINNLITLCRSCHLKIHRNFKFSPVVQ